MNVREKKRKGLPAFVIILLVLFLLVACTAGYLYFTIVRAPMEPDDPHQLAASAPMAPQDRFRFSPADQTVQVKIDRGDLWSLILDRAGDDFLADINAELSAYDLSVTGCAIHMDGDGLRLDLELLFRQLRMVAQVPCSLEFRGQQLTLVPTGVKLGRISLPIESLLSSLKLEYELNLPVIRDVTRLDFSDGALLLTGSMEADIRALVSEENLKKTAVFSKALNPLLTPLLTPEGYADLLDLLAREPGRTEDLYRELLILADPATADSYVNDRSVLLRRFFPGIDFSALAEAHTLRSESDNAMMSQLDQFFTRVVYIFNNKQFRLSEGQFLYKKKAFHPSRHHQADYALLFSTLDPDSFFLVLVDAEDGFIRRTSSLYRLADEKQQFTQPVDFNRTYILGCVFRSPEGRPFLIYEREDHYDSTYVRSIALIPLTEEETASLQIPGQFGVWTG